MYKEPTLHTQSSKERFFLPSRVRLIAVSVGVVWIFAIGSRIGLVATKGVELYPRDLFLYLFMLSPAVVAAYVGVKEKVYPYRVTVLVALAWSVVSFLVTWAAVGTAAAVQGGVILAFLREGVFYGAFLVLVALVAHKIAMRSNNSYMDSSHK